MIPTQYPITIEGETVSIGTAGELVVALDVLQGQHDRAVLEQLAPHLAEVLGGPSGLYATRTALSVEDRLYLLSALGPRLVDVVQRAGALRDIFATMAHAEVEELLLGVVRKLKAGAITQADIDAVVLGAEMSEMAEIEENVARVATAWMERSGANQRTRSDAAAAVVSILEHAGVGG